MKRVDLLTELLRRERHGQLEPADRERLEALLTERATSRLVEVLREGRPPRTRDDELVARASRGAVARVLGDPRDEALVERALARALDATGNVRTESLEQERDAPGDDLRPEGAPPGTRWARRLAPVAAAAAVLLATGLAAAAFDLPATIFRLVGGGAEVNPAPSSRVTSAGGEPRASGDRPREKAPSAEPAPSPRVEPAPAEAVVEEPSAKPPPRRSPASASEWLERAQSARSAGRTGTAIRAYRALQRRYPSSPEAQVSRVSLGRLLLDRRGNPRGALREFDAYLRVAPRGSLAQEALLGRALAHRRLGRDDAERAAWETLLERFPGSIHARRARARLAEL